MPLPITRFSFDDDSDSSDSFLLFWLSRSFAMFASSKKIGSPPACSVAGLVPRLGDRVNAHTVRLTMRSLGLLLLVAVSACSLDGPLEPDERRELDRAR